MWQLERTVKKDCVNVLLACLLHIYGQMNLMDLLLIPAVCLYAVRLPSACVQKHLGGRRADGML